MMPPMIRVTALLAASAVVLTGCNESKTPRTGAAAGEILPGSVSDAMLSLDTVRSRGPIAPPVVASDGPAGDGEDREPTGTRPANQPRALASPDRIPGTPTLQPPRPRSSGPSADPVTPRVDPAEPDE